MANGCSPIGFTNVEDVTVGFGQPEPPPQLAALAAAIGVPAEALKASLADYEEAFAKGRLADLIPVRGEGRHEAYPLGTGPYCAIRVCAGVTNTMGGIDIDENCRVLNPDGSAIGGLYAAGSCTGGPPPKVNFTPSPPPHGRRRSSQRRRL